jgi:hypothetical protein
VESESFLRPAHFWMPGYVVASADTIKRRILCMYAVLQSLMILLFSSIPSRVSFTVDGWSNPAMKGFYAATIHWIRPATGKLYGCVIDYFRVAGGPGSGTRVGEYLFEMSLLYKIGKKILCTVSDNASDAVKAASVFARHLRAFFGFDVLLSDHQLRCFTHTLQIGISSFF